MGKTKISAKPATAAIPAKALKKFGRYRVSDKATRTHEGVVFDSKWEMETYKLLKQHLPADVHIHQQVSFQLQPKYTTVRGEKIREIKYVADFLITRSLLLSENSVPADAVVMDSKGHITDIFKLKNKMFMYLYKVDIWQVKRPADVLQAIDYFKQHA